MNRGGNMPGKNISSVDEKGRVLIPQSLRDAAHLNSGEKVVLEYDGKRKAVVIEPAYEKKLLRLEILLADSPGSLASAAAVLAKLGVDLVSTQSHSSQRGEAAVWEVECNPGKADTAKIRKALGRHGAKLLSAKWE
jgi:AbrB family looped-hinge helix DNA binding protein